MRSFSSPRLKPFGPIQSGPISRTAALRTLFSFSGTARTPIGAQELCPSHVQARGPPPAPLAPSELLGRKWPGDHQVRRCRVPHLRPSTYVFVPRLGRLRRQIGGDPGLRGWCALRRDAVPGQLPPSRVSLRDRRTWSCLALPGCMVPRPRRSQHRLRRGRRPLRHVLRRGRPLLPTSSSSSSSSTFSPRRPRSSSSVALPLSRPHV